MEINNNTLWTKWTSRDSNFVLLELSSTHLRRAWDWGCWWSCCFHEFSITMIYFSVSGRLLKSLFSNKKKSAESSKIQDRYRYRHRYRWYRYRYIWWWFPFFSTWNFITGTKWNYLWSYPRTANDIVFSPVGTHFALVFLAFSALLRWQRQDGSGLDHTNRVQKSRFLESEMDLVGHPGSHPYSYPRVLSESMCLGFYKIHHDRHDYVS